jgi:AcrR family transcriptional regulator
MDLQPNDRRRRRQREEARRAILDASEALLAEDGYELFSMRRLAARSGYTAPTVYHYFEDKPALIDALLEERCRKLVRQLRRVEQSPDPIENARRLCAAFVRFGRRNPTHYQLLSAPREQGWIPPPAAEQARVLLQEPFVELAEQGRLLVADVELVQQAFWALLHGVISLQNARLDIEWTKALFEEALEALLRGFMK